MDASYDYGHWHFVLINIAIFFFFAVSYTKPKTKLDWKSCGVFMGFMIALFTEMYGFPLTIYFLSGWLLKLHPSLDIFAHSSGHLWHSFLGWDGPVYYEPFYLLSYLFIWGSVIFLAWNWKILYRAQKEKRIANEGAYRYVRHPQYIAFLLIMFGYLIQWPTLPTLVMFPIMVFTYYKLSKREEKYSLEQFGKDYENYQKRVPAFFPKLISRSSADNY